MVKTKILFNELPVSFATFINSLLRMIKKMIILFWALISVIAVCVICFLLNKYLNRKLVIFIFSIFSLAGLVVSVINGMNDYIPWFICSLPLIIYFIYIMIFNKIKKF
ncbi:MAG: hypothetical protein CMK44_04760 [Porticoccus sp.]|nr:hypothetical protein [Porticoccus sp.]